MMNFVVGKTFKDKFIAFFKTHQMVNTDLEEVWKIFDSERDENSQSSSAKTFKEIMNPWITKNGIPLITVKKVKNKIKLKQVSSKVLIQIYHSELGA